MHKELGQPSFAESFIVSRSSVLDQINALVDWSGFDSVLGDIYAARRGRPSYPPLVLFKCLLLQVWHNLSDPQLESTLADRLSWRRFAGLSLHDPVPDHSTISRFRSLMQGRDTALFRELTRQLDQHNLLLREGTMVDASLQRSARDCDPDARTGRGSRGFVHGYKAHVAVDQGSELIRDIRVTPGNVNETSVADELIQGDETMWIADAGYSTHHRRECLRDRGIVPAIVYRWHKHDTVRCPVIKEYNRLVSCLRNRVETVFAVWKHHMGWRRCRYMGLARNRVHVTFLALGYNMKRWIALA